MTSCLPELRELSESGKVGLFHVILIITASVYMAEGGNCRTTFSLIQFSQVPLRYDSAKL